MIKGLFKQVLIVFGIILIFSCDTFKLETIEKEAQRILPEQLSIAIPSSLNAGEPSSNLKIVSGDTISNYIRTVVNQADNAVKIVENSFNRIAAVETNGILEFSYTGLDGNTKNVSISENHTVNKVVWDYYMEIYNETFADLALRAYWNKNQYELKIVFKPSSVNVNEMNEHSNALVEIEYKTGIAADPYEKSMYIAIHGLSISEKDIFSPDNIILFVGQSVNILDIMGGSNNPGVVLFNHEFIGGRNWSFVAKVDIEKNIAAAELALPPSWIETSTNLMIDYSLKKVLVEEARSISPDYALLTENELLQLVNINPALIENPAYFSSNGFVSAGTLPSESYAEINSFEGQTPFVPTFVRDYIITLK